MAFSINRATLLGNLTRDPELRYTPSGMAVCSLSMATNNSVKNKQTNEWNDVPTFHNLTVWGNKAEWCAQNLQKGMKVYVEGRIENRSWEDQNGVKKYKSEVVVAEIISMSNGKQRNNDVEDTPNSSTNSNQNVDVSDADLGINFDDIDLGDLDNPTK